MSSDADYAAFLDKANQDTGANNVFAQSKSVGSKSVNTEVPKALEEIEEYYVSDADEPFEPVSLKFDGDSVPSADNFAKLLSHDSEISSMSEKEFDRRDQYKKVVDAVKKVGSKDVSIFRLEHSSTRAEYYIVSLDKKGGRIVGLKALAVES
ncbi:hypothetical protein AOQ84DRAFT_304719 [Glonium stellatum]|uniref:Uncharacterized protein n=1 Tax=Glonium stellatum TaxID=574774 RepID=A0A8E2EPV9_9PEZI|nr:hypothetical protein AOQ84DRAFT_304719 [Glonium stellatum]